MVRWHGRSPKKQTGGRIWPSRKKRRREIGGEFAGTTIGEDERRSIRMLGGRTRAKLLSASAANVADPKTGLVRKARILAVVENPANPYFARGNILTKGALIETELGRTRVTSRPSRGVVNAVLLGPKEGET